MRAVAFVGLMLLALGSCSSQPPDIWTAAREGNVIDAGADVNRFTYKTYLGLAIRKGDREVIRLLIDAGADVNALTGFYYGDLGYGGLANGIEYSYSRTGDSLLIKAGMELHPPAFFGQDSFSATPLVRVIKNGNSELFTLLINAGADINTRGKEGIINPLQTAIAEGKRDMALELLRLAAEQGDLPLMRILLKAGSRIDGGGAGGKTLLSYAAMGVKDRTVFGEIIALAREQGFTDVDHHYRDRGQTALQVAAQYANVETAKLLLDLGADVNAGRAGGDTPLYYALERNYYIEVDEEDRLRMLDLLMSGGGDVNIPREYYYYNAGSAYHLNGIFTPVTVNFGQPRIIEKLTAAAGKKVRQQMIRDLQGIFCKGRYRSWILYDSKRR